MEPFQMILFLFHMFHMCFLVSTVITMTCWSMNPCYDVIITSIPGTSQQYGDGDALEILEFHIWAKYDPNQARPAVTRCDHDGVSCGLFLRSSTAQDVWPFCQIKHPCHWIKRLQTLLLLGKAIVHCFRTAQTISFFWRKPFILAVFSRVAQGVSSSLWKRL